MAHCIFEISLWQNINLKIVRSTQVSSRGCVDPVRDPLLLRKSRRAGNRTRNLWICSQKLWPLDHRGSPPQSIFYLHKYIPVQQLAAEGGTKQQPRSDGKVAAVQDENHKGGGVQSYIFHLKLFLRGISNSIVQCLFLKHCNYSTDQRKGCSMVLGGLFPCLQTLTSWPGL
jgi:hypothetical protein